MHRRSRSWKSLMMMLAVLLAAAQTAYATEKTFTKTLNVNGNVQLEAFSGSGDITIHNTGDASHVVITGHVHPSTGWSIFGFSSETSEQAAEAVLKDPPIEQNGNWVRVGRIDREDIRNHVSVSYEITVPKSTQLKVNTGSGDIRIDPVAGPITAHTGSGNVRIHGDDGDLDANAGSGD